MVAEPKPDLQALDLGAWSADRAQLTRAPRPNFGDVDDLSPEIRFQVHVSRMIRKRECTSTAETEGAAAFILVTPEVQSTLRQGRTFDRHIHTGRVRLTGRLHFVTPRAASSAYEEYEGDDNGLFDRIEALQCDHLPALIYLPGEEESSLSYYPNGTKTDEGMLQVQLNSTPITEADILAVIDAVYRTELCTPDNSGPTKVWENQDKGYPIKEAERTVQQFLRVGLAGRFNWCSIRAEQAGKNGRTDLEIVDDRNCEPGVITHHALLELKVLRSFSNTGSPYPDSNTEEAILKGVNQANSYGNANNSLLRILCCFDMRTDDLGDDVTFAHVQQNAATLGVRLRRWYMYRSSELYRDAEANLQLAAANDP